MIDDSLTNVTNIVKYSFISSIISSGETPAHLSYCGDLYEFLELDKDKFIYRSDSNYDIYVQLPMKYIEVAKKFYEKLTKFKGVECLD